MNFVDTFLEKMKNPVVAALVAIVLGFAIGLLWGWVIQPIEFTDALPKVLHADYQREYLRMTIDSFTVNSDTALATQRWNNLGPSAQQRLAEISVAPGTQDKAAIDTFGQLMQATAPMPAEQLATEDKSATSSSMQYLLVGVGLIVVAAVGFFAYRILRPSIAKGGEATPAQQAAEFAQNTQQTDYSEMGLATPITQSMTSYVVGDDLYDESFSIESQAGEFMGEYGVGISDTIGVGDPKKVTALEIWLFDKNDIKTATKVLMSEHAFNDPAIYQRLEAKGELVVIGPQKQVMLETETLQLLVTVADLEYGSGPLPPSSYFDRTTLELAIWPKNSA